MDYMLLFDSLFSAVPNFALGTLCWIAGWYLFDKTVNFDLKHQLTQKDNPAVGSMVSGYQLGLGLALVGTLFGTGLNLFADLWTILSGGILSIILMRLSITVNNRFILYRFNIDKEIIVDKNCGTGQVVASSSIATGLILLGAQTGMSDSWLLGIRDILVYWLAGQVILVAGGLIFQLITNYDVHGVIEHDDNEAAGWSFGGWLIALGIIICVALKGASSLVIVELKVLLIVSFIGLLLFAGTRIIVDKLLLPGDSLSDEVANQKNLAAGKVACFSFITIALILSAAIENSFNSIG
jgi:uncharacterized membrane protein YjfL (UPF0719 family)